MTTSAYFINSAQRKVDLFIMSNFNFDTIHTKQRVTADLGVETGGQVCTGIVKLCQKVMLTILTAALLYDEDQWGTTLSQLLITGATSSLRENLDATLTSAINRTTDLLKLQQDDNTPADEALYDIVLENADYDWASSTLSVSLSVENAMGDTADLVVPISLVP